MKAVYVVGGDPAVVRMFEEAGWGVTFDEEEASLLPFDLVCFTGGADIHPSWYGEEPDGNGYYNCDRDLFENEVYVHFLSSVPMVGICRGGQFLNVMNGGTLIQHLGRTVSGIVKATDPNGESYDMHVDHHQGIVRVPDTSLSILAFDAGNVHPQGPGVGVTYACWYPETRCLCFQPHPEWGHEPTKTLFFNLLEEYL